MDKICITKEVIKPEITISVPEIVVTVAVIETIKVEVC